MSCFQRLVKATEDTDLPNIVFIILGIKTHRLLGGTPSLGHAQDRGVFPLGTSTTNQRRTLLAS